jgi:hypothetical protein
MVLVQAAVDGAQVGNKILAWDYSQGKSWDKVNYCGTWEGTAFPDIGAITNVWNPTAKIFEVYLSRYTAGKVYRSKSTAAGDVSLFNDDSIGYFSAYRTCSLPQASPEPRQIHGFRPRIIGGGTIFPYVYTLDNTRSHALLPVTASATPGKWPLWLTDIQSEAAFLQFDNNGAADAWFKVAGVEVFYDNDWVVQR